MKSRRRPPLNLTEAEPSPDAVGVDAAPDPSLAPIEPSAEPVVPEPEAADRPMSERQRRRLEQARLQGDATPAGVEMTRSADAPPAVSSPSHTPVLPDHAPRGEPARHAYALAALASVLWIGGVASWLAYEVGAGGAELNALRVALFSLVALAPVGLALMLAHASRHAAALALETRRARDLSNALVAPTALAAREAGQVLTGLRGDIDHAALAAERARNDMALLREALAEETRRLNEAAETAGRTARELAAQLGAEREAMGGLGERLDRQAAGVVEAVERQSRMVGDASDLAQAQLREAEAALAARAADLAAAAGEAQDAARAASDDLARQTLRLETAGSGVAEQIHAVEEGLGQQRASLVTAAYALRTDQEDFSAQVESQRAQLVEQLSATRQASSELNRVSAQTRQSMRELVEAAGDQFKALVEMSQREADGFDNATKLALDRFEALAAESRDLLIEETRRALEAMKATADESRAAAADAAHQAQIRADRLGEALFEAAQKADQAADARIEGARRIVGETADMVDQTGEQVLNRLEAMLERMARALSDVDAAVAQVDARTARLPQEARDRVEAVRTSVEQGLAALSDASRKAAEDTAAVEAGFQDRVRRNYDMLTEAVKLMGVVSGDAAPRRRDLGLDAEPARPEERDGLRGRLKLEAAPKGADSQSSVRGDAGLDWADLGRPEPDQKPAPPPVERDLDNLTDRITAAIRRMGVDPNALLPRARVEEAARALASGDAEAARHIVRRVAPAAVRSVSRRVLADSGLQAEAEAYVRAMSRAMAPAASRRDDAEVLARLSTDGGRAFMLLDAAIGDLA
ncbi:tipN [Brevundimonas sp. S30B]|uniref:tipN n=1 Tax=unclassified Brevundimonas TaxID=2622653 RepID=UPI00107232BE|nr:MULTISPECIES: tipN [unclassified Brevundimonas]QBX38015.1 tipN [Brevundimonas sp. MF30-B]TFW02631.1 tipN [Brevundimonas sp. S30B]